MIPRYLKSIPRLYPVNVVVVFSPTPLYCFLHHIKVKATESLFLSAPSGQNEMKYGYIIVVVFTYQFLTKLSVKKDIVMWFLPGATYINFS